jgi:hypothetical protein
MRTLRTGPHTVQRGGDGDQDCHRQACCPTNVARNGVRNAVDLWAVAQGVAGEDSRGVLKLVR